MATGVAAPKIGGATHGHRRARARSWLHELTSRAPFRTARRGERTHPDELCDVVRALAEGTACLPTLAPIAMKSVASRLETEDLPILGMLAHRTPPAEIAATLRMDEAWLRTRRWAMLNRLTGGSERRTSPRHHPPVR